MYSCLAALLWSDVCTSKPSISIHSLIIFSNLQLFFVLEDQVMRFGQGLMVTAIHERGVVASWNEGHPMQSIEDRQAR